jgi:hypothetical protein
MLTLQRARNRAAAAGDPIPTVFKGMADAGVHFRRSQFCLLAAGPGVGKSLVSVTLALRAGIPALYLSADSDEHTMYTRLGAMLTGWKTQDVEQAVRDKSPGYQTVEQAIQSAHNVRWNFNPDPDTWELEQDLLAFSGVYGEMPSLIVVDNLKDLYGGQDGDWQMADRCEYLKVVARQTGACVIALHHVTGEYDDGNKPVPMSGLIDKISKKPELIITLNRNPQMVTFEGYQTMNACIVKNRGGRADASGSWAIPIRAEMDTMRLEG